MRSTRFEDSPFNFHRKQENIQKTLIKNSQRRRKNLSILPVTVFSAPKRKRKIWIYKITRTAENKNSIKTKRKRESDRARDKSRCSHPSDFPRSLPLFFTPEALSYFNLDKQMQRRNQGRGRGRGRGNKTNKTVGSYAVCCSREQEKKTKKITSQ